MTRGRLSLAWRCRWRPVGTAWTILSVLRAEPEVCGPVASAATVSHLVVALAEDVSVVERVVGWVRARVRRAVWGLAGRAAPTVGLSARRPLVIGIDAALVTAHWRQGGGGPGLQEGTRVPPLDRVDRPRPPGGR